MKKAYFNDKSILKELILYDLVEERLIKQEKEQYEDWVLQNLLYKQMFDECGHDEFEFYLNFENRMAGIENFFNKKGFYYDKRIYVHNKNYYKEIE